MSDIGLSQDQIDALLGGAASAPGSMPGLTQHDTEALADFERETMGTLPSVFNAMTGFDYHLANIEYTPVTPEELPALIGLDLVFSFPINVGEAMTHYLVLDAGFAKHVASSLMGAEVEDDSALSEMELSAISEVVSQANGSFLTNIAAALKTQATGASVTLADVDAAAAGMGAGSLMASIYLQNGDGRNVLVRHIIPGALAQRILGKLHEPPMAAPLPPVARPTAAPSSAPAFSAAAGFAPAPQSGIPVASSGNVAPPTTQFAPAAFSQLSAVPQDTEIRNLDILLDVPLTVTVELGKTHIPIKQILEYGQGSLITLDKLAGEPIDLLVNGKYFAKGEVVVIDENFGVRITSILSPAERLAQLS
jgi:flagellar motor switch protein FliN/FliY